MAKVKNYINHISKDKEKRVIYNFEKAENKDIFKRIDRIQSEFDKRKNFINNSYSINKFREIKTTILGSNDKKVKESYENAKKSDNYDNLRLDYGFIRNEKDFKEIAISNSLSYININQEMASRIHIQDNTKNILKRSYVEANNFLKGRKIKSENFSYQIKIKGNNAFMETQVKGDFAFMETQVKGGYAFWRTQVKGDYAFWRTQVKGDFAFDGTKVIGNNAFRETQVKGRVAFMETQVKGDFAFRGTQVIGNNAFRRTQVKGGYAFRETQVEGDFAFRETQVIGNNAFDGTKVIGNNAFRETQVIGNNAFRETQVEGRNQFKNIKISLGSINQNFDIDTLKFLDGNGKVIEDEKIIRILRKLIKSEKKYFQKIRSKETYNLEYILNKINELKRKKNIDEIEESLEKLLQTYRK